MSELKACPLCGSAARSDNGFIPIEGVEYVWCTNQACKLSDVDIDFTPEIWNRRAPDRDLIRYALVQSGWPQAAPALPDRDAAWEVFKQLRQTGKDTMFELFMGGWQAALAQIPQPPFADLDAAVETIASGWEKR